MDGRHRRPRRHTRLRFGLTTDAGTPIRFLVQLEYLLDGEWREVARFDHERAGREYADVRFRGLHLDVYAPHGEQVRKVQNFPPIGERAAVAVAEQNLNRHCESLVTEFEGCL